MGVNKYNPEGYYDPTAYLALTNIIEEAKKRVEYRPIIYVCSPFAKDMVNTRRYCRYAVSRGYIPIAPHLYFPQFMVEGREKERKLTMFMNIVLLNKCSELWVFGETISEGMAIELERAKRKSKPIRYFSEDCKEVVR